MDFLTQPTSWLGMLGSIGMLFVGHLANKYIIPYLQIGKRKQYAQFIAVIADEATDDLKNKYPEKEWLRHLDEAVDVIISICEVAPDVAQRAAQAAASRK